MAIIVETRGGVNWWVITESEAPTWRMLWDDQGIVQDLRNTTEEMITLLTGGAFEANSRDECMAEVERLILYFDPDVES